MADIEEMQYSNFSPTFAKKITSHEQKNGYSPANFGDRQTLLFRLPPCVVRPIQKRGNWHKLRLVEEQTPQARGAL